MPQGDRTGPQGQSPETGKGQGKCGRNGGTSKPQRQGGRGRGQGSGRGQGKGSGAGRGRGKRS